MVRIAHAAALGRHLPRGAHGGDPLWVGLFPATAGFLLGIAAVLAEYRRRQAVLLDIPFTVGQIVLWSVAHLPEVSAIGVLDKAVQVALVAVLVVLALRSDSP